VSSPHHPARSRIGERAGPYRILRLLGEGAAGQVLAAEHEELGILAAVKVFSAVGRSSPRRFFKEALAANSVLHPGIVKIFDHGRLADGCPFLVMEYVAGESLDQRLCRLGPPPPELALRWIRYIASAMAAAHAAEVVHRDLKPSNVMLQQDPDLPGEERVKIVDFGIARVAREPEGDLSRTPAGALLGTARYMAPEQCRGAQEITGQADVYALGVILYELVAGRAPFLGAEQAMLRSHLLERPAPLSDWVAGVPPALEALVARMLEKDPSARPRMSEVGQALRAVAPTSTSAWGAGPAAPAPGRTLQDP
jgi:serine/threonine-protein kinase